jgi:hypothetical protein
MGRWDKAVDKSGGGIYMDIQPGRNKLRVLNDPVVQNKEFDNGPTTIFSWLVWDYKTNSVRILSKGSSFIKKFDFFMDAWGDALPMKCDIIIEKEGSGLATRYEFAAVPIQEEMASDWREQAKKIDLRKALPGCFSIKDYVEKDHGLQYDRDGNLDPHTPGERQAAREAEELQTHAIGPITTTTGDIGDEPINLDDIPF